MPTISCAVCNEKFQSRTNRAKYCSDRCRHFGKPSASGLSCFICGEKMYKSSSSKPQGEAAHNNCLSSQHGSAGMYANGCRCGKCIGARTDRMRTYLPQWRAAYKAKHGEHPGTAYRRRYRARFGHNPPNSGSWIDHEIRLEIYERDDWKCKICDEPIDVDAHWNDNLAPSLDHIVPRSLGGSDDPDNLRTAHRSCNSSRGVNLDI